MTDAGPLVAFDTNVLIYAEGIAQHSRDAHKPGVARRLIADLAPESADSDDVGRAFRTDVGHLFRFKSAGRSD